MLTISDHQYDLVAAPLINKLATRHKNVIRVEYFKLKIMPFND